MWSDVSNLAMISSIYIIAIEVSKYVLFAFIQSEDF